jgi:hypothetical protein
MICLLVGVYYQMVWPATLQKVCHYKCPYFVGMSNKDRDFIRYGEVCEPTKFVEMPMLKGSGNIESIATQAVLAKKQIEKQRYELMVHIRMKYGMNTWDEILRAEGQLRKAKAKALEEQRKFMERSVLIVVLTTIIGGGLFALWNWADYLKGVA